MAKHIELGKKGEWIARQFLQRKGYEILAQNWRYSRAEIDLIALDEGCLVFIEVKTRGSDFFGPPASFVDTRKQRLLSDAATAYMDEHDYTWEIRFDIIGITLEANGSHKLQHYKDAFFPGME